MLELYSLECVMRQVPRHLLYFIFKPYIYPKIIEVQSA